MSAFIGSPSPFPPAEDDVVREQRDLARRQMENAAARSLEASTIGKGGLIVKDGGSITVEAGGDITLEDGDFNAGTLNATSTITAGSTISTPGTVQGGAVVSTGGVTGSGTGTFSVGVTSIGAYCHDITYTRRGGWWGNDGRAGYASSSIEKKLLVDDVDLPDPLAILDICDTFFHYKAELDKRDNPENPEYDPNYHVALEWGTIAEWLHDLGLWQVVIYENHVKPISVHYELMGLLAIRAAKHIWAEHLLLREDQESDRADIARILEHLGI